MKKSFTLALLLLAVFSAYSQNTETHDFITYDTTYQGIYGTWMMRITRPANMFTPGSADTASRPALITMPGIGEMGNSDQSHLTTYGPHYWLQNGWDGSVVLGNGTHYPILITLSYVDNPWPSPQGGADVLSYILNHYHIKRNSVHLGGLSQGSFVWTSMIAFEQTAGDETGMKMVTSLVALEGFTMTQSPQFSTWNRGDGAYQVWASKYHGKYFGLEGTADYRNVAEGEKAMNSVVKGSAHFSYENLGGGAHCCWNSMYDPNQHNWQSFPPYGPYVATGADTNSRGTYQIGSSIFQWMLRQGDTSIVGSTTPPGQPLSNYVVIPATVQAEGYSAMNGVATAATNDVGGGLYVGWINYGSWMDYTISAPKAGAYTINFRVSSTYTGATLQVMNASGTALGMVSIPNTGDFGKWATVGTVVNLPAGDQTLRIYNNSWTHWNINWMQFVSGASGSQSIPGTIQAESYSAMSGIATETTADAGGGLDVGWIDNGDWMDYTVNVAAAGVYTVNFRLATPNNNATMALRDTTGKVLATMSTNSTGGFQSWVTLSTKVTLPAGLQTLRLISTSAPMWNINWIQFVSGTTSAVDQRAVSAQATAFRSDSAQGSGLTYFRVYPNPVKDRVVLDISNVHVGKVKVLVISPSGSVVQTYQYDKLSQEMQMPLNVGNLAAGLYIIRIQGVDWFETKKIEKW
jgi:hypothetical protein